MSGGGVPLAPFDRVPYNLNRLDEPVFMAVSKALLTGFGIHWRVVGAHVLLHAIKEDISVITATAF